MSTPAEKAEDGLPNCTRPSVLGVRWGLSLCVVDTRENRRKTRIGKPKSRDKGCWLWGKEQRSIPFKKEGVVTCFCANRRDTGARRNGWYGRDRTGAGRMSFGGQASSRRVQHTSGGSARHPGVRLGSPASPRPFWPGSF